MSPRHRKLLFWLIAIVLFFAGGEALHTGRYYSSDRGYREVTGRDLPANLTAMGHASGEKGNFLHESHYWLLHGPAESLRELAPAPEFARADAEAAGWLQDASRRLVLPDPGLQEGYKGSVDGARDRWLLILQPGDQAVFIY